MQIRKYIYLLVLVLLGTQSCEESRLNLDIAIVPREVTNFEQVNSGRDDFNSAGPLYFAGDAFTLVFSSNRNSNGADFDLVSYQCYVNYDQVEISFDIWSDPWEYPLIDTINSNFNEWGPYLTFDFLHHHFSDDAVPDTARIFFSSDRGGTQDIYYSYYSTGGTLLTSYVTAKIGGLNTDFEEGYLCLHPESTTIPETCYFTSNRHGSFDIYMAVGEPGRRIETSGSLQVSKVDILSGAWDDKCPYIVNNMMVFTSDREGGEGGFDLWYAVYENGTWSEPENFGPGINTKYDEYRPVIIPLQPDLFVNDMLIFSSNRPEGKGGFDLYFTGLDKRGTTGK